MTDWTLWGSHPLYANGVPIRLTGGTLASCRQAMIWRKKDGGWSLVIRKAGKPANL